ncbi:hypothetical protein MP228_010101 [Amoeboaphelidium protococcarum]|nr:hypothetical protein MP228_010101 [Amoeboaphelidium protococcarum]
MSKESDIVVSEGDLNFDYPNAREHAGYQSASGSSCVGSGIAAAMVLCVDLILSGEKHLLRYSSDIDSKRISQIAELVRVKLMDFDQLPLDSDGNSTQEHVKQLLQYATDQVQVTPNSYEWKYNVEMPPSVAGHQKQNVQDSYMMSRIFWPRSSIFNFMLSRRAGVESVIGPLAQCKPDSELSKKLDQYTLQAGLNGIGFLQRVFPMLPSQDISSIFGQEWYVYVPLMSHKSLYILRIDLHDIYSSGKIIIFRSDPLQGAEMARWLTVWITWAIGVYDQLLKRVNQLNQPVAQYCWIPPYVLSRKFPQVNLFKLVARPSFYNPIYIELNDENDKDSADVKVDGYVYKLYSTWTANSVSVRNKILNDGQLCQGWVFDGAVLKMPYYHRGDLYQTPPHDFKKLVDVVLQVLNILTHLQEKHQLCHCDIRAPNICWYTENSVTLIDYDLASDIGSASPKDRDARDNAPEQVVYVNHDLWLLGVMILQLTSDYFTWDLIVSHRNELVTLFKNWKQQQSQNQDRAPAEPQFHPFDFTSIEWKETFVPYVNQLQFIIEKCLQLHNRRWQMDELKTHLESLKQNI